VTICFPGIRLKTDSLTPGVSGFARAQTYNLWIVITHESNPTHYHQNRHMEGCTCLLAKTRSVASLSSSSPSIRLNSSLASCTRSRSLLSTTNIKPETHTNVTNLVSELILNYVLNCISLHWVSVLCPHVSQPVAFPVLQRVNLRGAMVTSKHWLDFSKKLLFRDQVV